MSDTLLDLLDAIGLEMKKRTISGVIWDRLLDMDLVLCSETKLMIRRKPYEIRSSQEFYWRSITMKLMRRRYVQIDILSQGFLSPFFIIPLEDF